VTREVKRWSDQIDDDLWDAMSDVDWIHPVLPTTPPVAGYSLLSGHRLRRVVKVAKRRYRDRVESQMEQLDTRCRWQGLRTITDYWGRTP